MKNVAQRTRESLDGATVCGQENSASDVLVRANNFLNEMTRPPIIASFIFRCVDSVVDGRVARVDVESTIPGQSRRRDEYQRLAGIPGRTFEQTYDETGLYESKKAWNVLPGSMLMGTA